MEGSKTLRGGCRCGVVRHFGSESVVEGFFTDDRLSRERTEDNEEIVARWRVARGTDAGSG